LELLIIFDVLSFDSLRLPNAVRRVIYAPGASSGEVVLVEQSRSDILWPVDILLGADGNVVLSVHWRAFALVNEVSFTFLFFVARHSSWSSMRSRALASC
jgi:hypothetical protein